MTTVNKALGRESSPLWLFRRALGVGVTVAATFVLTPLFVTAGFLLSIGLERYDTSGLGGPMRGCDSQAANNCTQPVELAIVGFVIVVVLCVLAALAGVAAGGWDHKLWAGVILLLLSAGPAWLITTAWPVIVLNA